MALSKVVSVTFQALTSVASNTVNVGATTSVSNYYAALVRIRLGRGTGTAFTTAPIVRLEVSAVVNPTANDWDVLAQFQMAVGTALASQAVSGTEAAGQTVVTLAAGTNFAGGDYIFFHNTTLANSEWSRVVSVSVADLTLEEAIVNTQTGATVRDQAEQYLVGVDLTSVQNIRLIVDGHDSGQAVICEATLGAVTQL